MRVPSHLSDPVQVEERNTAAVALYARLGFTTHHSYLTREAWTGVGGAPKATNNMVFTGMRYYIP